MMDQPRLQLHFRSQQLTTDANGYRIWHAAETSKEVPISQTAIIICDMWDRHWSRGAAERVAAMAPRLDGVVRAAREQGVQIIHAPSETMDFYAQTPARLRVAEITRVAMPEPIVHPDPELPVDASDGGSDTGETSSYKAWTRQHPAIWIDPDHDGVSDDGEEIFSFLRQRRIDQVCLMGVHTNMCILRRPFGIKAMVRLGIPVALVRDLTDAMYNPERPPYVSHAEGTRLVIEYIEKFWCPTIESRDFLAPAF